jgi:hypothetical protein
MVSTRATQISAAAANARRNHRGIAPIEDQVQHRFKARDQTVAMVWLALFELTSCDCIWINCATVELPADEAAPVDELLPLDGAAVVNVTVDPSA